MEQPIITSLVITRRSTKVWYITINGQPVETATLEDAYRGGVYGDYLTIKSANGAILYHQVPYTVVRYVDQLNSANSVLAFQTPLELGSHLVDELFFIGNTENEGSGGVDTLLELSDNQFVNYLGRAGQAIIVSDNEQGFTTANIGAGNIRLQELTNYQNGNYFPPNSYVITSSRVDADGNAIGFQTGLISSIIDRPALFGEPRVVRKGYTYIDNQYVVNEEIYTAEVGDFTEVTTNGFTGSPAVYRGRYLGGDFTDLDNHQWIEAYSIILPNEPGYAEDN